MFSEESYVAQMKLYGTEQKHLTAMEVQALPVERSPTPPVAQLADASEAEGEHAK